MWHQLYFCTFSIPSLMQQNREKLVQLKVYCCRTTWDDRPHLNHFNVRQYVPCEFLSEPPVPVVVCVEEVR